MATLLEAVEALRRQFEQSRDDCLARALNVGTAPNPEGDPCAWREDRGRATTWDLAARCLAEAIARAEGG